MYVCVAEEIRGSTARGARNMLSKFMLSVDVPISSFHAIDYLIILFSVIFGSLQFSNRSNGAIYSN